MVTTDSGMFIDVKLVQLKNALEYINVTESGIITSFIIDLLIKKVI